MVATSYWLSGYVHVYVHEHEHVRKHPFYPLKSRKRHFLYKQEGEETALTRIPIVVNNVLIPKGTLCFVSKRDDVIELVKPIRLTLFNLPLDGEGAEVFRYHLGKIYSAGLTDTDVRAVYRILDDDSCGSPRGS